MISQLEEVSQAYNIPGVVVLDGLLDVEVLAQCVRLLTERHEILRTVFRENEQGEIRQVVQPPSSAKVEIAVEDLRHSSDTLTLKKKIEVTAAVIYDLRNGPLLRVMLFQISDTKWVLYYGMHHIISDGWSMDVLIAELASLYNALITGGEDPLPPLRIQYKDYAEWEQGPTGTTHQMEARNYWLHQFKGELPVLELPSDRIRPTVKPIMAASLKRKLTMP